MIDFIKVLLGCIGIPVLILSVIIWTVYGVYDFYNKNDTNISIKELCYDGVIYLYNDVNLIPKVNLQSELQSCK